MPWKPIFFSLLALGEGICFYDATPPSNSEINDDRNIIAIRLQGFSPNVQIRIRYWDDVKAYTYPQSYTLYTDSQGGFLGTLSVAKESVSVAYLLYVDQNGDNTWDTNDFGVYRSGFTFSSSVNALEDVVTYSVATLTLHNTLAASPNVCIYMPQTEGAWDSSLANSVVEYPDMGGTPLTLSDWFLVSYGGGAPTYLPSGTYEESCINDANANNRWDNGESVTVTSGVIIP